MAKLINKKDISDFFYNLFFRDEKAKTWTTNYICRDEYNICELYFDYLEDRNGEKRINNSSFDEIAKLYEDFFVFGKNRGDFYDFIYEEYKYQSGRVEDSLSELKDELVNKFGADEREAEFTMEFSKLDYQIYNSGLFNYEGINEDEEFEKRWSIIKQKYADVDFSKLYEGKKLSSSLWKQYEKFCENNY